MAPGRDTARRGVTVQRFLGRKLYLEEEARELKIEYWQKYDALYIRLKENVPEATGAEMAPGIVFHYSEDDPREVVSIEMDGRASELANLGELRIEGLPVSVIASTEAANVGGRGDNPRS